MTVIKGARWFENAVIYAIDVESFQDTDGDGVGDFEGLTERLDYLDRLGIDCIWLLPFYDTPNLDNGYDVRDYYAVDDRLGTLGDVVDFLRATDDRGIRVIIDLVVNHTSDQHPWFRAARADPDSKYRDYYVWTDDPSEAPDVGSIFPGEVENDRVWTHDEQSDAYYYHRFYPFQPDLNLQNPDVREEIRKIVDFWLELGVDGFRIDAATLMIQQKQPEGPELTDPHYILRELRENARRTNGEVVLLAEADDDPEKLADYFSGHRLLPDTPLERDHTAVERFATGTTGMDLLLNFVLNAHLFGSLATETATPIERCLTDLSDATAVGQWANFLRNYDELNLGRLPEEDQQRVFERFAPDEDMRIYGRGIRRRLAPMLDGDRRRIELAFNLLFSMPGTPLILYGDELGMGEDLSLRGRQAVRTPMQWSDDPNAGFSSADASELVAPVVDEGPFGYEAVNAIDQWVDDRSLVRFVQGLIGTRKSCPEIGSGDLTLRDTGDEATLALQYDLDGRTVVVVHNLTGEPRSVQLGFEAEHLPLHVEFGDVTPDREGDGECSLHLRGYGSAWLRVGVEGPSGFV